MMTIMSAPKGRVSILHVNLFKGIGKRRETSCEFTIAKVGHIVDSNIREVSEGVLIGRPE